VPTHYAAVRLTTCTQPRTVPALTLTLTLWSFELKIGAPVTSALWRTIAPILIFYVFCFAVRSPYETALGQLGWFLLLLGCSHRFWLHQFERWSLSVLMCR